MRKYECIGKKNIKKRKGSFHQSIPPDKSVPSMKFPFEIIINNTEDEFAKWLDCKISQSSPFWISEAVVLCDTVITKD